MIDNDKARTWVEALRSGTFQQGHGMLYNKEEHTYCCLGVYLKAVCGFSFSESSAYDKDGNKEGYELSHVKVLESRGLAES